MDNQNYQDLTLTKFTYDIYYEGILFGSGSNEYNTVFSPRSQGSVCFFFFFLNHCAVNLYPVLV